MLVRIYTDGSARGNPDGPGGYGAVLKYVDPKGTLHEREFSQGYIRTTNNRMELMAAIVGLEALKKPCRGGALFRLPVSHQGLQRALDRRLDQKGWTRGKKEPVKNVDLWKRLLAAKEPHQVTFIWVKGHAGHPKTSAVMLWPPRRLDGDNRIVDPGV